MSRLRLLLALAHLCLVTGAVALYLAPSLPAGAALALGVFVRWMVPSPPTRPTPPLRFVVRYGLAALFAVWLLELGLSEFIAKAWDDRLSPRPLILASVFLLLLVADDWRYFLKLSPAEVDAFYARPPENASSHRLIASGLSASRARPPK